MKRLSDMTTIEAKAALDAAKVAILPVGSLEQHGPHLPLDTDAVIAEALATRLASAIGTSAILCPLLPYGLSEHHLAFAGTVTLRHVAMLSVLADIFESLQHQGLSRVLIVNGHGGNIDVIRLAARDARRDRRMIVGSVMWSVVAGDVAREHSASPAYGHACETETSLMLALHPDRVAMDQIPASAEFRSVDVATDPPRAIVDESIWLDEWSSHGAIGDPSKASSEAGHAIVDAFLERTLEYANRMIERPLPGGNDASD